jgi:hypothetical protein
MNTQRAATLFELTASDIVERAVVKNQELLQQYNLLSEFRKIGVTSTFGEVLANTRSLCKKLKLSTGPSKDLLQIDHFCRELSAAFFSMSDFEHEKKSLEEAGFHLHTEIDLNFHLQKIIIKNHKLLAGNLVLDERNFCFEVSDAKFLRAPVKDKINYLNDCLVLLRQVFISTHHDGSLSAALCQHYSGDISAIFAEKVGGHNPIGDIVNHVYSCLSQMMNKVILSDSVERGTQLARLAFSFMAMELSLTHRPSYRWLVLLRNFKFNVNASPMTAQKIFNGPGPLAGLAKKLKSIKNLGATRDAKDNATSIIKELANLSGIGLKGGCLDSSLDFNRVLSYLGGELGFSTQELEVCELMFILPVAYCPREYSQQVSRQKKAIVNYLYLKCRNDLKGSDGTVFHRRFFLLMNAVVYRKKDAVNDLLSALSKFIACYELKKSGSQEDSPRGAKQRYLLNKINPTVQAELGFYGFVLPADSADAERYIIFINMLVEELKVYVEEMRDGKEVFFQSRAVRVMALLGGSFWSGVDNAMTMFCSNVYKWVDDVQGQLASDGVLSLSQNILAYHVSDFAKRSYYFNNLCQGELVPSVGRSAEDRATQCLYTQVIPEIKGVYSKLVLEMFCQNVDAEFGVLQVLPTQVLMTPERPPQSSSEQRSPEQKQFDKSSEKFFAAVDKSNLLMYGSPGCQLPSSRAVLVACNSPGK